jgi:hypothetical protein
MKEGNHRKTAAVVGALFIIATATSLASAVFLGTALDGSQYLINLQGNENNLVIAVLFEMALAVSLIGIGSLLFPTLRKRREGIALAYAGVRLMEAAFIVIASLSLLLMLTMGKQYHAGMLNASEAQAMGALLRALRDWSYLIGTLVLLGLGALLLNYLLFDALLVPRWISAWGIIGAVGILLYGIIGLFGANTGVFNITALLAAPLAVQEMILAVWLIVKGFRPFPQPPLVA